jgi:hypothetical protein
MESLFDDALVSVTKGDFAGCSEKFDAAAKLHELNWASAAFQFQCRKRAGKVFPISEAHALYELDRQAIRENAFAADTLQKLTASIGADENTLSRMGSSDLAAQLKSEFEVTQSRRPSEPTAAATGQNASSSSTRIAQAQLNASLVKHGKMFDFRGLRVGDFTTPGAVEAAMQKDMDHPYFKCGSGSGGMQVCNGLTIIAGAVAEVNSVIDDSGRLIRISLRISSDDFEQVTTGAQEKYGPPTSSSSELLQNRAGATFANRTLIWGNEKGNYIQALKYAGTIDKALVYFGTPEDTALLNQTGANARRTGAF